MLLMDPEAALAALSTLLPKDEGARPNAFAVVRQVVSAKGEPGAEVQGRLRRIARIFDIGDDSTTTSIAAFVLAAGGHLRNAS